MTPFGVGLIGLGRHGTRYAQHLLGEVPQARLVAVSRRNAEAGLQFAQRHNLQFYSDYRDLVADDRVQAILVVTPPSFTLPIAREAIRHKKPLLIEKPLAIHAAHAREIAESAAQAEVPLMTAHTLRYDATILKLKEMAPRIGKWQYIPLTVRMERRDQSREEIQAWENRGTLLENGIHLLDLARFLTGEEVHEAYCEIERPTADAPEEQVWARLTMHSGLRCLLDISRVSGYRIAKAEIVGDQGQACADWTSSLVYVATHKTQRIECPLPPTRTLLSVLQDFFGALEHKTPMPITGFDGQRAVELAEACYQSAAAGRPISLP